MKPASYTNQDVRLLADLLTSASIEQVVTYDDMSDALGSPIKLRPYLLLKALRLANAETGAVFATVRGQGQKRLANADAHLLGHAARRRIRRTSARTASMISNSVAIANDMPNSAKLAALREISTLGLIQHAARDRTVKSLPVENAPLSVADTARASLRSLGVQVRP